jgi:hypothetical protein
MATNSVKTGVEPSIMVIQRTACYYWYTSTVVVVVAVVVVCQTGVEKRDKTGRIVWGLFLC